jgi:AP-1 complex subunit gamma-1
LGQVDLLAEEPATPSLINNEQPVLTKSNKDLLLEIFGDSSSSSGPVSAVPQPTAQKSTVDDIISLFGSTSLVPASAPAAAPPPSYVSTPPAPSVFSIPQTQPQLQSQSPPNSSVPPTAVQARLTGYTAYEKNDLKVTLTPQTSPTKPGVVMILARFQVTGGTDVVGLNFQAAVPKVEQFL